MPAQLEELPVDQHVEAHDLEVVTLPLLREIISTGSVSAETGERIDLHSQISIDTGARLQRLVRTCNARVTLEIGLAFGTSALFICEALAGMPGRRSHIAIDPGQNNEWWRGIGLANLRRAGFEHLIDFRELPSHQAMPDIEREGVKADFAFIDGWHTFDYTLVDMFLVDRVLREGGIMVVDDADWPGVRKAIRYFVTNRRYRVVECWGEPNEAVAASSRRKRLRALAQRAVRWLPPLRKIARPELEQPDRALGLVPESRCVALEKIADDDLRNCFGHEPF